MHDLIGTANTKCTNNTISLLLNTLLHLFINILKDSFTVSFTVVPLRLSRTIYVNLLFRMA